MKISNSPEPLRPDRSQPQAADARAPAPRPGAAGGATERVSLSDLASKMAQLEGRFGGDFDARKVEEVRAAIAEGRFKVNPEAVADRLLASVGELLGRKS